jgi:hypothetical protein
MDNQVEGKKGAAVLDELIRQLKNREKICQMLGDLGARNPDILVAQLTDEVERIISWRHLQHELLSRTPAAPPKGAVQPEPATPAEVPVPEPNVPAGEPSEQVIAPASMMEASEQEPRSAGAGEGSARQQIPRIPSELGDEDYVYLHGVSRIDPDDRPSAFPFLLEEKGIDNRSFAFALDHQGLRFYGSILNHESVNLTKNGVLLLSKQEKIRMRGAHESILNDLRLHQILLPFEFGTVFTGRVELTSKIEARFAEIRELLDDLLSTRWWNLAVYALDSRTAVVIGPNTSDARRENDRGRLPYSAPSQAKRIDVKTLERILGKEKRAAESIHAALQPYAERSDIDMMVNLQSGSSDDWKIIFKASYELGTSMLNQFVRTVTDLQYQHFLMELMLSLTGNVESFSFSKP